MRAIQEVRNGAYDDHRLYRGYNTQRPLTSSVIVTDSHVIFEKSIDDIVSSLGITPPGKILSDKIKAQEKVRFLDVGCGSGRALIEAKKIHGGAVNCLGITGYPYHVHGGRSGEDITSNGIGIIVEDVQKLSRFITKDSFDLVTAIFLFPYLADPWSVLKQIYDVLKPGGDAVIYPFPTDTISPLHGADDAQTVEDFLLRKFSVKFHKCGDKNLQAVTIHKTAGKLRVPLSYSHTVENGGIHKVDYPIFRYKLDPRVLSTAK